MEDHMTKANMFSSDNSSDFTDRTEEGEPWTVKYKCFDMKYIKNYSIKNYVVRKIQLKKLYLSPENRWGVAKNDTR